MTRTITVTIQRTIDLEVNVGHRAGSSPTWFDPGDPEEWWIESATDDDNQPVELTDDEQNEAVSRAAGTWRTDREHSPDCGRYNVREGRRTPLCDSCADDQIVKDRAHDANRYDNDNDNDLHKPF